MCDFAPELVVLYDYGGLGILLVQVVRNGRVLVQTATRLPDEDVLQIFELVYQGLVLKHQVLEVFFAHIPVEQELVCLVAQPSDLIFVLMQHAVANHVGPGCQLVARHVKAAIAHRCHELGGEATTAAWRTKHRLVCNAAAHGSVVRLVGSATATPNHSTLFELHLGHFDWQTTV